MGSFEFSGIVELSEQLRELELLDDGELIPAMLGAGAEVVTDEWKKGIHDNIITDRATGEMENSVAPAKKLKRDGDATATEIYPQGKDRHGVRNAEKAFIKHYGRSNMAGNRFVDKVEEIADPKAVDAMEQVFDDYLQKEGI